MSHAEAFAFSRPSLIMRRLGVRGFDALQFDALDCLRNFLLLRLQFRQRSRLLGHDLIKLVVLMFQMGQMRFHRFQPFHYFFFHAPSLTQTAGARIKNCQPNSCL
jgi:hypothetical protein